MNPENPPPYPGPGPTAPYPPYPPQPMGPMGAPPPQGYPYPPPQGYPYQGYPQYGWQGGPQEPPKTTGRCLNMRMCMSWCPTPKERFHNSLAEKKLWPLWFLIDVWCWWFRVTFTQGTPVSSAFALCASCTLCGDDLLADLFSRGLLLEHWWGSSCFCLLQLLGVILSVSLMALRPCCWGWFSYYFHNSVQSTTWDCPCFLGLYARTVLLKAVQLLKSRLLLLDCENQRKLARTLKKSSLAFPAVKHVITLYRTTNQCRVKNKTWREALCYIHVLWLFYNPLAYRRAVSAFKNS